MAERTLDNPLTDEDFDTIEKAIAETNRVEAAANKARSAGINVDGIIETNRANRERLQRLMRAYKPGS